MAKCYQCPNKCGVDRDKNIGKCSSGTEMKIARSALHFWEEPIISGTEGSGTIFFSGCSAKCVFCQNYEISQNNFGETVGQEEFIELMKNLEAQGACNINLVNPTHYRDNILAALSVYKPSIPIVYNTNGYENVDSIKKLSDKVDIFLPDFKYADDELAVTYSSMPNYKQIALEAISEMIRQKGKPSYDDEGLLKSGVVVRHLVLPNHMDNSKKVLDILCDNFQKDSFVLSVMFQYTPTYFAEKYPQLNRKLKPLEAKIITNYVISKGFEDGFIQELSSADLSYVPSFDLTGL